MGKQCMVRGVKGGARTDAFHGGDALQLRWDAIW